MIDVYTKFTYVPQIIHKNPNKTNLKKNKQNQKKTLFKHLWWLKSLAALTLVCHLYLNTFG